MADQDFHYQRDNKTETAENIARNDQIKKIDRLERMKAYILEQKLKEDIESGGIVLPEVRSDEETEQYEHFLQRFDIYKRIIMFLSLIIFTLICISVSGWVDLPDSNLIKWFSVMSLMTAIALTANSLLFRKRNAHINLGLYFVLFGLNIYVLVEAYKIKNDHKVGNANAYYCYAVASAIYCLIWIAYYAMILKTRNQTIIGSCYECYSNSYLLRGIYDICEDFFWCCYNTLCNRQRFFECITYFALPITIIIIICLVIYLT